MTQKRHRGRARRRRCCAESANLRPRERGEFKAARARLKARDGSGEAGFAGRCVGETVFDSVKRE